MDSLLLSWFSNHTKHDRVQCIPRAHHILLTVALLQAQSAYRLTLAGNLILQVPDSTNLLPMSFIAPWHKELTA
jgi:hypothetical protein